VKLERYTIHQFSGETHYHIALHFRDDAGRRILGAAKYYSDGRCMYKVWPSDDVVDDVDVILGDQYPNTHERRPSSEELDALVGLAIMIAARSGAPYRPVTDQLRDAHRIFAVSKRL
jgi:hypothetical protein